MLQIPNLQNQCNNSTYLMESWLVKYSSQYLSYSQFSKCYHHYYYILKESHHLILNNIHYLCTMNCTWHIISVSFTFPSIQSINANVITLNLQIRFRNINQSAPDHFLISPLCQTYSDLEYTWRPYLRLLLVQRIKHLGFRFRNLNSYHLEILVFMTTNN